MPPVHDKRRPLGRRALALLSLTILMLLPGVLSLPGTAAAAASPTVLPGATAAAVALHVSISGRFRDFTTGHAIGAARITIAEQDGSPAGSAVADAAGDFTLSVQTVAGARLTARYEAAGYLQEESVVEATGPELTLRPLLTPVGVKEAVLYSLPRPPAGSQAAAAGVASLAGAPTSSGLAAAAPATSGLAAAALTPPATIRVYRTSLGIVQVVDFKFYCKHVLPSEWIPSWPVESLRAGAIAVKEYAWYYVSRGGKWPSLGADVQDGYADQWYDPNVSDPRTDAAVDYIWNSYLLKNNVLFLLQFCGDQTLDATYHCTIHPDRMPQWGTYHLALDKGWDWRQIIHYYWDPVSIIAAPSGGTTRFEQTDTRIAYNPSSAWAPPFSTSSASAGSYARASAGGSYVTIKFSGTYLAWIATVGTTLSKADVSLDGGTPVTIDLARSAVAYQQNVWDTGTLTAGLHTVKISRNKNDAAGKFISLDAVDVSGTLLSTVAPSITSLSVKNGATSGGTSVVIRGADFSGTTAVTFGGVAAASFAVDSATQITAIAPAHSMASVRVQVTTPVGSSSDTAADDYAYTTRFEQTDTHIVYTPSSAWAPPFSTSSASAGSYARASAGGSYVTIRFNGTYLAWIATAGTTLSKADVSVDGGAPVTIDLARSAVAYQQNVWSTGTLASGVHTVKISRNKNDAAGKFISLDAVEVQGSLN